MDTQFDFGDVEVGTQSPNVFAWKLTNTGDLATATLSTSNVSGQIVIDADTCTGHTIAGGDSCKLQLRFLAPHAGARSATISVTPMGGATLTLTLTATGKYRLTLSASNPGGTIATSDGLIGPCSTSCSGLYANNASVTVIARTTNGSGNRFDGWAHPVSCAGPIGHDCTIVISGTAIAEANFVQIPANLAFVSSALYTGDLGGIAGANATCNSLATAAGINDTTGDAYIAWLSANGSPVLGRLPSNLGGFTRTDGAPFALSGAALLNGAALVPLNVDEAGLRHSNVENKQLAFTLTATDTAGAYLDGAGDCGGWTRASVGCAPSVGLMSGGPVVWTAGQTDSTPLYGAHLACLGIHSTVALAAPTVPANAKLAYLTSDQWLPGAGIGSANAFCNAHKPAGFSSRTFVAFLATSNHPAAKLITSPTAEYYRPDGIRVGLGSDLATGGIWSQQSSAFIDGIFARDDQTYDLSWSYVFTGAASPQLLPSSSDDTCTDWTATTGGAPIVGKADMAGDANDWFNSNTWRCETFAPIYCIEQ